MPPLDLQIDHLSRALFAFHSTDGDSVVAVPAHSDSRSCRFTAAHSYGIDERKVVPIIGKVVPIIGKVVPIIGKVVPIIGKVVPICYSIFFLKNLKNF
jgi:hypothetical protein